jgi:sugar phosphate isomerase/epimerase
MTRRELLGTAAAAAVIAVKAVAQRSTPLVVKPSHNLGGAPAGFPIRSGQMRQRNQPFDFVEHCHMLGLGVVETRNAPTDPRTFRDRIESVGMRAIADIPLPRDADGVAAFDDAVKRAKEAGIISLHTAMTQRRYEQFDTLAAFQENFGQCKKTVALAEPVLRKYRMPLGIENHKGWRAAEQAAWIKSTGSEWIGVHFDFGNNIALCEDPADTLRILAPYAVACHIKDMAVEIYDDGFLLSEVPLGEGILDIPGMVRTLQAKNANMPFDLEMITRDPLKIPVFTKKYWVTFDDAASPLPGRDLARVLDLVRKNRPKLPLPYTSRMSPEEQLKLEDENIQKSIVYARGIGL